jgi:AraC-like DNA-binding protein/quercetin dioxygenase-like cupin family protein
MKEEYYTKRSRELFISGYPMEMTTILASGPATPCVNRHHHDEIELLYISRGHLVVICNDEKMDVSEGDIIFVNSNATHFISFTDIDSELCSIIVHPNFIFDFEQLELKNKYINPIIGDHGFSHLLISSSHPMYDRFWLPLEQLIIANSSRNSGYEMLSRSYILQFWNALYEVHSSSLSSPSIKTESQDEQRVKIACTYINEHFSESITLEDISDSILVSKSECCRCFKRVCYVSPFEYLMKYRIVQAAKHIQENTYDSISDVACAVGFNNTSYFNKVFKKIMNCTPSEYKKSLFVS